jgi:cyclic beta-1,2-glucan synthetase
MTQSALMRLVPDAPQALCDILDGARGAVEKPIRAEIFGLLRFAQHGRSLAETHQAVRATFWAATFRPRLRSNIRVLREAQHYIGIQATTGYDISPAAEWLLDNFHLIEAQLKEIHEGLPRSYYRALPVLVDQPLAGLPRVYSVAWAFIAHTDGAFDDDLLTRYLSAYQEVRDLSMNELWALPTTLRVVLIENLRRLAERVATNKAAREVANLCCDRLNTYTVKTLQQLLALLDKRAVGRVFLAQMAQRVQDRGRTAQIDGLEQILEWLKTVMPDLAAMQAQQRVDQTADNLSVSNAVNSLRAVADADWPGIIARTSELMRLMLTSRVFEAEDAATRDRALHSIEALAKRSGKSELAVANILLSLMRGADPVDGIEPVVGYWLHGDGRQAFMLALGVSDRPARKWRLMSRRIRLPLYLGALLLGTLGLVVWVTMRQSVGPLGPGSPNWLVVLGAVLMIFPASEAVVAVVNRLISESARPRHLPRLALAGGITAEHRVLVVIPAILLDVGNIDVLVRRLQLHHLANPERFAQFALLTDWADAETRRTASDQDLLASATRQIQELNSRYPEDTGATPRFLVLHRERVFSKSERRWIGWERKRGKLELLIAALADNAFGAFLDLGQESRVAAETRYVVTLDSDTQLPPGRLRELVGVAAHPENRPRVDVKGHVVVAGYGIYQPRVATPLPSPGDLSHYHWLFAGQCGIDPYSAATSEVYQDLFGEGTFTGKGLLDVRAVHAVLSGRLPEETVLSHDLLEGSLARCAAVTDIMIIEDAPFHADVAASRVHRWTRGDWQLLPFLFRPQRYPMRAINRWTIFDNLRRSLVPPMSLALLLLALGSAVVSPWAALALTMAAFSAGPLMGAVVGFAPSRDDVAKRHFYRQAANGLARAMWGGLWLIAQLLQQSLMAVDAVVRALYRMAVSRRHLLQWTTAATAQARAKTDLPSLLRQHWSVPIVALVLLGALLALSTPNPLLAVMLCLLWSGSPVWTWWVSRPRPARKDKALPVSDQLYLEAIARDTWHLFERCITAEDNYLPPDNLQTAPHDMVAHRTSPTNIGLYLLSVACARSFGWIGTTEMLTRLEATLATLSTLRRHRGHLLNWYDTQTCAPLMPMYVSTVDSGNLSGHLLAVGQACIEQARENVDGKLSQRFLVLSEDCERLAWQPDFGFLYHRKRHLFHIGFRVAEQQLDAGFYDLLASESRLTSLLAIAKGDVPVEHWGSLGRPYYAVGATAGLRSWSGSMFEYLMPTLVLDEPHGSVLSEACHAAFREQVAFAGARSVPWGISESAYAASDHTLAYQYAPQGVPRLALRRTPPDELVIAPYATALVAQIAPHAACLNFAALEALVPRAPYGFIEALDFSPARRTGTDRFVPVFTFMAHHQGMTIVALANTLLGGVARRWGMANAHIEAVASLLHELTPREVSGLHEPVAGPQPQALQRRAPGLLREIVPGATVPEPTHVLGNGRYSVELRPNGAGWSHWGATGITRCRDDALRDACGSFFYLRWDQQPQPVSITQHPAPDPAAHYHSIFHADRVCFDAAWPALQAHTTVWVSPEDDIEFRKLELSNLSDRTLDIELMSAFEVTLAEPRADDAHPAFSNLFVKAEWRFEQQALVFERKPRLAAERGVQAAHFLADTDPSVVNVRFQTDRQRWLGRNRKVSQPLASFDGLPLQTSGPAMSLETGLDPVCALAVRLRIPPGAKAQLTFATAASDDGGVLHAVIDKYRQASHVQRASLMSATLAGIRLRALAIRPESFAAIQMLTTALVLSLSRPRALGGSTPEYPKPGPGDRRQLWRLGVSGDRPIILVTVSAEQGLGLLRALAGAMRMWSWGGIACDLVVVNSQAISYQMALHQEINVLRERFTADCAIQPGPLTAGFHLLRAVELSSEELGTLRAQARIELNADGRPLQHHVDEWCGLHEQALEARFATSTAVVGYPTNSGLATQAAPVSVGKFVPATGEFRFDVSAQARPSRPWINVLANPAFGAQLTECGGGYTWALNSRLNQLTAWSNDPVADPPSEWFLLQDRKTRQVWSVAPSAWGDASVPYSVAHGQGYTVLAHRHGNLDVSATWCVDALTSVKQVRLRLLNRGHKTLHLRVTGIAEWMMGANRSDRTTVHTALHRQRLPDQKLTALLCTQLERSAGFGEGTAFLALASAADESEDWTCDRRELFDARGCLVLPDHLGKQQGGGLDPCAALSTSVTLTAGESAERVFLLGYAESPLAAQQLAAVAAVVPAIHRLEQARNQWDRLLGATTVKTPDPLLDAMVNRWLLYQTVSCRLWAKAGFYQAGGATGFRDQLQDAMALAWAAPQMLRAQIVLGASRQFEQGDVQHWWHTPGGAGVRTHFSDDLLWLPYACAHYLRTSGDAALLDERVPFLTGAAVAEGAEDAYYTPEVSAQDASVYEHAARTIDRSLRVGVHGLPLMGSGDWNDGMNRVGHEGRGESVWLGWFLCQLVADFVPLARQRGDTARAQAWEKSAQGWRDALNGPGWDGQWFKRAFFDNGQALGASANAEARIDLIAQAWAVLSNATPAAFQRMALEAVEERLVDHDAGLIRLLDPPLVHAQPSAGYIQAYPPGVRENGGQYSHAGVWALMAQARFHGAQSEMAKAQSSPGSSRDHADAAYRYFTYLSPAHRASDPTHGAQYGIEPYAMAGDVYTQPPYVGRGGWSWYTGAAAWLHRAAIESIFGLRQGALDLTFSPCLPSHWQQAELTLKRDGHTMRFILVRATPMAALAETASLCDPLGARLLRPGESLKWPGLSGDTCFVIPLLDESESAASAAHAEAVVQP